MTATQTELELRAIELSIEAFNGFCDDISGMFGVDMKCVPQQACQETINGLKKRFKKLSAVNNVDTNGAMHGTFYLIFDQGGLFTLSGVIVMLPENRILEEIKRGTIKDVSSMNDAVRETGNLCVGSWDRVFREEYEGHGHFVQNGTFIGNPWDNPEDSIKLKSDESFSFVPFEMTVGSFPTFQCGVIYPKSIFTPQSESNSVINDSKEVELEKKASEPISIEEQEKNSDNNPQSYIDNKEENKIIEENSETTIQQKEPVSERNSGTQTNNTVSETIKKMTQSHADLPGQSVVPEKDVFNKDMRHNKESEVISFSVCAKDIMETNVSWCGPDESVQQAIDKMRQFDTGYLLIGNESVLEGIVSRSDITGAVSPYLRAIFSKWRRPLDDATLNIKIKWIMSRPVHTIKPDINITKIMENMRQLSVRCFPVIDSKNNVQGIVTVFDIFKALNTNTDISTMGKTLQVPLLI